MTDLRIEAQADIPLGAVLEDVNGVRHVFVGRTPNTVGWVYYFQPEITAARKWTASTYAHMPTLLKKFPGATAYAVHKP